MVDKGAGGILFHYSSARDEGGIGKGEFDLT